MKFKKLLIIFLCVALLAAFSVSCFATDATTAATNFNYGFYISPGDYLFNQVLDFSYLFIPFESSFDIYFNFICNDVEYEYLHINHGGGEIYAFSYISPLTVVYDTYDINGWLSNDYRYITVTTGFYIYDYNVYQWWQSNVTRVDSGYDSNLLDGFLSVFTAIGQWISGASANLTSMFFVDNSLTFVGTLSVAALSMAVAFLIIGLISRFLRFKA